MNDCCRPPRFDQRSTSNVGVHITSCSSHVAADDWYSAPNVDSVNFVKECQLCIRAVDLLHIFMNVILGLGGTVWSFSSVFYVFYLIFQLYTHNGLYSEREPSRSPGGRVSATIVQTSISAAAVLSSHPAQRSIILNADESKPDDERLKLSRPIVTSVLLRLIVWATLVAFNTPFATDSLSGLMTDARLSPTFVGIVLLPLLGNDLSVVLHASHDNMDLCILLTVGKCLQIVVLVIPFSVLLGWIMDKYINLHFDPFEAVALFASVV